MTIDEKTDFDSRWHIAASGCWLWAAGGYSEGYGWFRGRGSHRASWELHRGPIPRGMCVLHRCDVRACVNPEHLFIGSLRDNIADMVAKRRQRGPSGHEHGSVTRPESVPRGEGHYAAKLTDAQVAEVRARGGCRRNTMVYRGVPLRISQSTVSLIATRRRRKGPPGNAACPVGVVK